MWELLRIMGNNYGSLTGSPDSSSNPEATIQQLLLASTPVFDFPLPPTPSPTAIHDIFVSSICGYSSIFLEGPTDTNTLASR